MKHKLVVLLIDHKKENLEKRSRIIKQFGFECILCNERDEAIHHINSRIPDIIITDLEMPALDGMDVLRLVKKVDQAMLVIMSSTCASWETAVEAMKQGAFDFVENLTTAEQINFVLEPAVKAIRLSHANISQQQIRHPEFSSSIVRSSKAMIEVFDIMAHYAKTNANVFIWGETGTGKELIARAIYEHSHRNSQSFVPVDCGALPEQLLESELFGHEKGAFTGATNMRQGLLEYADKGTFFFDEVLELSPKLQVKLLRVLQERQLRRLGGHDLIPIDIRIISATNRNPEQAVKEGILRNDLYFRLNVLPIRVPPLRERKEDIPLLVNYFTKKYLISSIYPNKSFSPGAMEVLVKHHWPGNVRELQAVVHRVLALSKQEMINEQDILTQLGNTLFEAGNILAYSQTFKNAKEQQIMRFEQDYISNLLKKNKGNIRRAALEAKLSRKTIYDLIDKYSLDITKYKKAKKFY